MIPPALLAAAFIFSAPAPASASPTADNVCERQMIRASRVYGVPLGVLFAVGMTETGGRTGMRPYLLNVEGRSYAPVSLKDAVAQFDAARRGGAKLIDLGCMQINHYYHGRDFESVEAMLDPARNVDYAARFLKELRAREGSWTLAAARYNAGPNNDPAQKRYVCRVITNMIAGGFGSWTENARAFCR